MENYARDFSEPALLTPSLTTTFSSPSRLLCTFVDLSDTACCTRSVAMSKLNANAFSFVPGGGFQPAQPPLQPIERPPQTEAPAPAPTISLSIGGPKPAPKPSSRPPSPPPTISLNIGGPKPAPPPPAPAVQKTPTPVATKPTAPATSSVKAPSAPAKSFTLERAKTDTTAVALDVKAAADEETLKDLFGHSACLIVK